MVNVKDVYETTSRTIDCSKPAYCVPLMSQIRGLPWNGFKVVSTFSGAGGSCTGYRMAGFKVVWANEFVPAAQASYRANAADDCYLDCRDIKHVQPQDILTQCNLKQGDLDLFDGSPPCQAFSTAGKRHKNWGKKKTYEHGVSQCNETLFTEYIRLLRGLMPKTFVAENVSGLVKGVAKGYFLEILRDLKASGYRVICKVLDAQWLGVPQTRQRTIFVGVRNDIGIDPVHPKPLQYRYSVRDALPWIHNATHDTSGMMSAGNITDVPSPAVMASRAGTHFVEKETELLPCYRTEYDKIKIGKASGKFFSLSKADPEKPCQTIDTSAKRASVCHPFHRRKFTIAELKRICAFPDDFILCGTYAQQWERLGNSVPPVMMYHIASAIRDNILQRYQDAAGKTPTLST